MWARQEGSYDSPGCLRQRITSVAVAAYLRPVGRPRPPDDQPLNATMFAEVALDPGEPVEPAMEATQVGRRDKARRLSVSTRGLAVSV